MSLTAENITSEFESYARTDPDFFELINPGLVTQDAPWTDHPHYDHEEGYTDKWMRTSTAPQEEPKDLDLEIRRLFWKAREQVFEDGMESEFSKGLIFLVRRYSNAAMEVLTHIIVNEKVNTEVASEALRWLGRMEHSASYRYRLWLLERSLLSSSARIRDGAALGLASLNDPHAIPHLKRAIEKEDYAELREDMEQVLAQLETTKHATRSEDDTESQVV